MVLGLLKKVTDANDVKKYLSHATVANDGLLVVLKTDPFFPNRERIIIPRDIAQDYSWLCT